MNDFESIFKKYDPHLADLHARTEAYTQGIYDERQRILDGVQKLEVDSFNDICYKADVLNIVNPQGDSNA